MNLTQELVKKTHNMSFFEYIGLLPNPDKLLATKGNNRYDIYRKLKNDPHIWSCIQSRKSGVVAHKIEIVQDEVDADVYELVRYIFSQIDLNKLVRQMLEAVLFGFQTFDIVWERNNFKHRQVYTIKRIDPIPQECFVYDLNGDLLFKQSTTDGGKALPEYKLLNIQHEADTLNPYGQGLLSKCYWSCTFKNAALRFWVNFVEKFGIPMLIASVAPQITDTATNETVDQILSQLKRMQDDNIIVTSDNISVQVHDNNKLGSVDLYRELIALCNFEISKTLLSQTLTTEITNGSYAAAKTHNDIREDVVRSDMDLVERGLNDLIRYICRLNFGEVVLPRAVLL
jgi:phage gp29-like protein